MSPRRNDGMGAPEVSSLPSSAPSSPASVAFAEAGASARSCILCQALAVPGADLEGLVRYQSLELDRLRGRLAVAEADAAHLERRVAELEEQARRRNARIHDLERRLAKADGRRP